MVQMVSRTQVGRVRPVQQALQGASCQSLRTTLDAEYRIELDQYKEESDSDLESEVEDSWEEVARPRRSHHHWQNRSGRAVVFFSIIFHVSIESKCCQATHQLISLLVF